MEHLFTIVCLALALLVFPACYLILCIRMRHSDVSRPPYLPFFFIFGSFGGWLLAFGLSPSGLAASSIVFLVTLAPLSLLASAIWLWRARTLSRYHRVAFYGSISYFGFLAAFMCIASLVAGLTALNPK